MGTLLSHIEPSLCYNPFGVVAERMETAIKDSYALNDRQRKEIGRSHIP